ncbi:hypothetical protein ACHQM5_019618 [Ranunculus cassubicifolius]
MTEPSQASIKLETQSDASSRRTQVRWSSEMDSKMIMALYEEALTGGKRSTDNGWKPEVLKRVAKVVLESTTQDVRSEHLRARLKTLKKDWGLANVCSVKSGFGINPTTGTIDADHIAWEGYVKANPDAQGLRYKKFPFYNELCLIFGKDQANGSFSVEGHDVETPPLSVHNKSMIDILDDEESVEISRSGSDPFDILSLSKADVPKKIPTKAAPSTDKGESSTSTKGKLKRARSRLAPKEDPEVLDSFKCMAKAADKMAGALEQAFNSPDYAELAKIVATIPGLNAEHLLAAIDLFETNREAAAVFKSLPNDTRTLWLRRKLSLPSTI